MLRRLLIIAAVLVVLLVAADRVGDYAAEHIAADKLKSSQHLTSTPSVDIAGFPFLTQLASGNFDEITVDATGLPVGRTTRVLQIARVHVVLHGVKVSHSFSQVHADHADATASVGYAELSRALGVKVAYAGSGQVRAAASVTILGQHFAGSVTARPEWRGSSLAFVGDQVRGAGNLAAAVVTALRRVFDVQIPFSDIPFQVRVDSVTATSNGLQAKLSGANLTYEKR